MESEQVTETSPSYEKMYQIFSDFMTREVSTCHHGLLDHLIGAKSVVNELQCLLDDAATAVQNSNENLQDKDFHGDLDSNTDIITKEDFLPAHVQKPEITDYAALMAVIYGMVKQDYEMQERIVSSLSLKSSSGEMESYCLMWSLRPFIDDEIIHKAWRLIR